MTEFKITVEATALANAIENLARAISANGMGNTIPAVTASVPKVATTPASTSAPAPVSYTHLDVYKRQVQIPYNTLCF